MGHQSDFDTFKNLVPKKIRPLIELKHVAIDNKSISTRENAIYFKRFAKKKGFKKIHLITSGYHMRRARYIFEEVVGKSAIVETTSVFIKPFESRLWRSSLSGIQVTLSEFFKLLLYRSIEKGFW